MDPQRRMLLINAHRLAKAYGQRASDILNGSNADYLTDLEAYNVGSNQDQADADRNK